MRHGSGGPAFPVECSYGENGTHGRQTSNSSGWETGMSLRDYFAAKALQGMLCRETETTKANQLIDATWAYEYADAMLQAREVSK